MAEKRVIELEVTTNEKSLKAQLREAQAEVAALAEKFGATSDQAVKAAKKAAELKDAIGDAKALTDAYNPDAKFNALSQSIGGVLNGFQAYEGALGLLGVESEELQKTLLKVQSAMALTQGINGVLESRESFKNLEKQVSSLASSATSAFKNMTAGSKALALTGIGLLITAIGLVIANWESVSKAIGLSNEEQKKYAAQQKAINEEAKKQREEVAQQSKGFAVLISQLKATNANSKERVDLINKINSQYGTTLKNLKDEKKFQEQVNAELASYLEYQKAKYSLQKNEDLIVKNLSKQDELESKIAKAKKEQTKALEEGALKRKTLYETDDMGRRISLGQGYANEQAAIAYEKATSAIKKYEIELKNAQKRFENYGEAATNAQSKVDKLTKGGKKYVEQSTSNTQNISKTTIDEKNKEVDEVIKLETIKLEKLKILGDSRYETLQGQLNLELIAEQEAARKKQLILEVQAIRARKIDEQANSFKVNAVKQGLEIISNLTELFGKKSEKAAKKAFQVQKAAQIASALINTYQSATGAYASQFLPVPDPTSPVRGGIAAGLAVASGLVNVAKIASQKFEGGSSGGGSTPSSAGGGVMTPNFNVIGSSGVNQLAQIQQQPTRAYVVSGDVANGLSLERNRLQNASF